MESRAAFEAGVNTSIYTNTHKLIKGNTVRDQFLVMADSVLFIISDKDIPGGYLGIDATNHNVDISFIKSTSSSGKFLKDDGSWAIVSQVPDQSSADGKFLKSSSGSAGWVVISQVPDQSSADGKFLRSSGGSAGWVVISQVPDQSSADGKFLKSSSGSAGWVVISQVPDQSSADGKFLKSSSGSAGWVVISQVPDQSSADGKFLKSTGGTASWATVSVSPAGSNTNIQYNNSGAFGGSRYFVWEASNKYFKAGGKSLFGIDPTADNPTAFVDAAPATETTASLRIRPIDDGGSTPSAPNEGEIWNDGHNLWIHISGMDRQFNLM